MNKRKLPPPDVLRKLLTYRADTGELFWNERQCEMFPTKMHADSFNSQYAGKRAFISFDRKGYRRGMIDGVPYYAHRVAFAIYHGAEPDEIDHINGVRGDNRIANLRSVTSRENSKNTAISSANTSGRTGVFWSSRQNRWMARITVNGARLHLGSFRDIQSAIDARANAEKKHGFHENHGRRAAE